MSVAEANPQTFSIEEFLEREATKELLRFSTAGSVDDGKSTLIGRLLYDARGIFDDQLASVKKSAINRSSGPIDFSLLTDGLRAEREQGITIDVAYRYFATPKRKFIIADTPGHEQYTRNMATGASTASLAVVLVDARNGVMPQTRRHAAISSLLGIPRIVLAVNKMDLVDYSEQRFEEIRDAFLAFAAAMGFSEIQPIPVSALEGDNVARRSAVMGWFQGPCLLEYLESAPVAASEDRKPFRFPVQLVTRPNQFFRGYAGSIVSGSVRRGDPVMLLPSGKTSRIASISTYEGDLEAARAPQPVTLTLEDERDVSRGEMMVHPSAVPRVSRYVEANLVWMTEEPLANGRNLLLKHTTQQVSVRVMIQSRLDINTMDNAAATTLALNDIGVVRIDASRALFFDTYGENRLTGSFILIDPVKNGTVAAGMILRDAGRSQTHTGHVTAQERHSRNGHQPAVLSLSLTSLAARLERRLFEHGCQVIALDPEAHTAALLAAGMIVIAPHASHTRAIDLDNLPWPAGEDAAVDAIMVYLEQKGVLWTSRFTRGEGI